MLTNFSCNYSYFQKTCFLTPATKSGSDVCINSEQQRGEQQCGSDYNSNNGSDHNHGVIRVNVGAVFSKNVQTQTFWGEKKFM